MLRKRLDRPMAGPAQQSGRIRAVRAHLAKTGRNQQTNRPSGRIWGVEETEICNSPLLLHLSLSFLPVLAWRVCVFSLCVLTQLSASLQLCLAPSLLLS